MRILFITRPITEKLDEGSKKNTWQIVSSAENHQFYLLTFHRHKPVNKKKSNIIFKKVYSSKNFDFFQKVRLLVFLIFENTKADVYHYFFVPTLMSSRLFYYVTKLKNKKAIQSVPALYKDCLDNKEMKKLLFADAVVVYSSRSAQKLRETGLRNIRQINPGIDLNLYYNRSDKNTIRESYSLPINKVIVLFSGELSRLNSVNLLLSIIDKIIPMSKEINFVISCPIRLPEDLESLNRIEKEIFYNKREKRVSLLKQIEDFSLLLSACDIFLYPVSSMAGKIDIPLTVLEAMAAELPIILSDVEPLNEIFEHEPDAGVIVSPSNETAFAQAILKLSKDRFQRKQMGNAGRKIVANHYGLNSMIKAYEELYDEFTKNF